MTCPSAASRLEITNKEKYQVVKVSPGGSLPKGEGSELGYVILCFRVPTTSVGARGEGEQGGRAGGEGSELGARGSELGARGSKESMLGLRGASWGMLYYVLGYLPPLWGQGARGERGGKAGGKGSKLGQGERAGREGSKLGVRQMLY